VLAVLGLLASALPAAADAPREITIVDEGWQGYNPCTDAVVQFTSVHLLKLHEHDHNTVVIFDGYLETADGYSGRSADTGVYTSDTMREHVSWIVDNPDTGGKFQVRIRYRMDLVTGEAEFEEFTQRCIREPE
jgi:hypothetical protein